MSFSKRLINIRERKKLTRDELADMIGVSRPSIYGWEKPKDDDVIPHPKNLKKLAAALGVDHLWLRFGDDHLQPMDDKIAIDLIDITNIIHLAPIIKNFDVGGWLESKRTILQKGNNMSVEERRSAHFRYVIEGDSMFSKDDISNSFLPGEIIVIDPSCTGGINPGDYVLTQYGALNDDYKPRIYYKDGIEAYLTAINSEVKRVTIDENVKIVGKIIMKYKTYN